MNEFNEFNIIEIIVKIFIYFIGMAIERGYSRQNVCPLKEKCMIEKNIIKKPRPPTGVRKIEEKKKLGKSKYVGNTICPPEGIYIEEKSKKDNPRPPNKKRDRRNNLSQRENNSKNEIHNEIQKKEIFSRKEEKESLYDFRV